MDDVKITLMNGSPRAAGSTHFLLEAAEAVLGDLGAETEWLVPHESLKDMDTPYCTHCSRVCTGECYRGTRVEDDMKVLAGSDGIIVGSPVYFGTVSAPLKAFWDMTRALRSGSKLLFMPGGALAVGGGRFGGQETTIRAIHDIMLVQGMIVVGDSSLNSVGHSGAAGESPAASDENALTRARVLADAVARVALSTRELRAGRV